MSLIFIGDLEPFRAQLEGPRSRQYARLLEQADRYALMELPAVHPGESTTYMGIAMLNLALAYLLSGQERYLRDARRFMDTVLGYEKWGNAHLVNVDLSASWILFGLSLTCDWLRDHLTEDERERTVNKIGRHAGIMLQYRRDTYGAGWSTNFYQNHNWINMTGMAAAGYLLEKEGKNGRELIAEAREDFARVFDLMPEDGSDYEGAVYWRYGAMWLFVYAHLLKTQEGIDHFRSSDYLRNTFYYRLYQSAGDLKQQLNFGDCHDRFSGHTACVYYKTAAEYGDGYAQTLGDLVTREFLREEAENSKVKPGILPEAVFEFLWYDPAVRKKPLTDLPLHRFFPDLGLLAVRSDWSRDAKVFSIKCASPGGEKQWRRGWKIFREEGIDLFSLSHHHPDNLSYIYAQGGDYLTCEDGYNRNLMPDNHNVLLTDGVYCDASDVNDAWMASVRQRQKTEGAAFLPEEYRGQVTGLVTDGGVILYRGENTGIAPKEQRMREISRLFITDRLAFWVFVDVFRSDLPHVYTVLSNTDRPAEAEEGCWRYAMEKGDIVYRVFSDHPMVSRRYDQTVTSVMTTQEPDKVCRTHIRTLAHDSASPQREQLFIECFTPAEAWTGWKDGAWEMRHGGDTLVIRPGDGEKGIRAIQVTLSRGGASKTYEM